MATLTGVPIDEVPHFVDPRTVDGNGWIYMVARWLALETDHVLTQVNSAEWKARLAAGRWMSGLFLVGGGSPRGGNHMVAYVDDEMIDPHPSQDGLTEVTSVWRIR